MDENSSISEYYSIRRVGRPPRYTPKTLLEKANQYFQWCINHPMQKEEIIKYKEHYERVNVSLLRAYTIEGLCSFCDIHKSIFYEYEKKIEFQDVITYVRGVIYKQKFEGASSGLLKENIIIRDLKLKDTSEIEHSKRPAELQPHEVKMIQSSANTDYGLIPQQITIDVEHEEIE